jgi:hypothetical protein
MATVEKVKGRVNGTKINKRPENHNHEWMAQTGFDFDNLVSAADVIFDYKHNRYFDQLRRNRHPNETGWMKPDTVSIEKHFGYCLANRVATSRSGNYKYIIGLIRKEMVAPLDGLKQMASFADANPHVDYVLHHGYDYNTRCEYYSSETDDPHTVGGAVNYGHYRKWLESIGGGPMLAAIEGMIVAIADRFKNDPTRLQDYLLEKCARGDVDNIMNPLATTQGIGWDALCCEIYENARPWYCGNDIFPNYYEVLNEYRINIEDDPDWDGVSEYYEDGSMMKYTGNPLPWNVQVMVRGLLKEKIAGVKERVKWLNGLLDDGV